MHCRSQASSSREGEPAAQTSYIVQIKVQQLQHASLHPLLQAPVVRLHIVDKADGTYLASGVQSEDPQQLSTEGDALRTLTARDQQDLLDMPAHNMLVSVTNEATGHSEVTTLRYVPAGQTEVCDRCCGIRETVLALCYDGCTRWWYGHALHTKQDCALAVSTFLWHDMACVVGGSVG